MDLFGKSIAAIIVLVVLVGGTMVSIGYIRSVKHREACSAAGGVMFEPRGGQYICLRKDAVITVGD